VEWNKKTLRNIFIGVILCIIVYWLLHETSQVMAVLGRIFNMLSPFLVGAAIAFILNVPMRAIESGLAKIKKLKSKGLRRALALFLTVLAVLLVLVGVIYLLFPQLTSTIESLGQKLPGFIERAQNAFVGFLESNPQIKNLLGNYADVSSWNWDSIIQGAVSLITGSVGSVIDKVVAAAVGLGTGVFNGILSIFFAFYCLVRKEILARQGRRLLYSVLPEHISDEVIRVLRMANVTFSRFISGQCLEAVILGAMFAVAMTIFGMPFVPLVSVVIAVTALVPIVGAFTGCFIGAFFILVEDPVMAFWFVVMFLIIQQIEGNLIYPRVVGSSIGLPGMWVLVAVGVGGDLMGVSGMLLLIPVASVCYALLREFTAKRLEKRGIPKEKLQDHPVTPLRERLKKKKKKDNPDQQENNE